MAKYGKLQVSTRRTPDKKIMKFVVPSILVISSVAFGYGALAYSTSFLIGGAFGMLAAFSIEFLYGE